MRAILLAGILTAAGFAVTAHAQSGPELQIVLSGQQTGWIAAQVSGAPGTPVTLTDITAAPAALAPATVGPDGRVALPRAARWSCVRDRRLQVSSVGADGRPQSAQATIRTPSCRDRVAVALQPAHPRAGRVSAIKVSDRWKVGDLAVKVCTGEPGLAPRTCATVRLAAGQLRGAARVRAQRPGRHRWLVQWAGQQRSGVMTVKSRASRLSVLATGDSMIQVLDEDLRRRLAARGPITLSSDAHISTGISKPFMLDWPAHAAATARSIRPDVSVVFLGANDGFPIGDANCCNAVWQARYAARATRMMRSYARGGAGTVYWLLLPIPRRKDFQPIYTAVNRAVIRAAARFPGVVHVVDLRAVFTPGGRFRQTMRWHGHTVSVRQSDGVHLSVAGAKIAAQVIMRRMRSNGLVS
jgi:lysophospholipase L1-like esterase